MQQDNHFEIESSNLHNIQKKVSIKLLSRKTRNDNFWSNLHFFF